MMQRQQSWEKYIAALSSDMDRKFCIAVLVIGLIALSSVAEGNPAAR